MKELAKALRRERERQEHVSTILRGEGGVVKCGRCYKYRAADNCDVHDNDEIICNWCLS